MPRGKILVFSNPSSAAKEAEYNAWYSGGGHMDPLKSIPGMKRISRYKLSGTQVPGMESQHPHRYLCIYEVDDLERDFKAMQKHQATPTDAFDPACNVVIFEQIYSHERD
jgi:hypothetical protein